MLLAVAASRSEGPLRPDPLTPDPLLVLGRNGAARIKFYSIVDQRCNRTAMLTM